MISVDSINRATRSYNWNFKVVKCGFFLIFYVFLSSFSFSVTAQNSADNDSSNSSITLQEALQENSYNFRLERDKLEGKGGLLLQEEAADADIVTIGEMHATREIPTLAGLLIGHLQKAGEFDYLALEVSPWTAKQMNTRLREGINAYNSFIKKYPLAVPFYNFKGERDMLYQIVQNSEAEYPIWGLDQIFLFSTTLAFDRLKELAPDDSALSAIEKAQDAAKSASLEDPRLQNLPEDMPIPVSAFEETALDKLRQHFKGIPEAERILKELAISAKIYRLNHSNNYKSNQIRAKYLRNNLRNSFEQAGITSDKPPQIVIKVGARHAYRGMTPNNALDVGNLSVALAGAMGGDAYNVAILCGPGSQSTTFPAKTISCWPDYLGEAFKSLSQEQPVLFDLSGIYPLLHEDILNPATKLEDFLWAFDAVVLIPDAKPAESISSPTYN